MTEVWSDNRASPSRKLDTADVNYAMSLKAKGYPTVAIANMMGRPIPQVQAVFEVPGLTPRSPPPRTLDDLPVPELPPCPRLMAAVIRRVAAQHGLSEYDIRGRQPTRRFTSARNQAIAEIYALMRPDGKRRFSSAKIGQCFEGRDHSTIMLALRVHEGAAREDEAA